MICTLCTPTFAAEENTVENLIGSAYDAYGEQVKLSVSETRSNTGEDILLTEKELADMGLDDYSVAFCGELRVAETAVWPVTVTFRKSYGMILTGSRWSWTEVESGNTVTLYADCPIALLDKKPDVLTGFTLSGGNLFIILVGAIVILGGIAAAVIVAKKKKAR